MKKQLLKQQASLSVKLWRELNSTKFDLEKLVEVNNEKRAIRRKLKALTLTTK